MAQISDSHSKIEHIPSSSLRGSAIASICTYPSLAQLRRKQIGENKWRNSLILSQLFKKQQAGGSSLVAQNANGEQTERGNSKWLMTQRKYSRNCKQGVPPLHPSSRRKQMESKWKEGTANDSDTTKIFEKKQAGGILAPPRRPAVQSTETESSEQQQPASLI